MNKELIIVESPNKVKTIKQLLKGTPYEKATILASVGHIIELGNGGKYHNSGIYPEDEFRMNLKPMSDKGKVINQIKDAAKMAEKIVLMTDGDREGEIIAWSLIKFCNLDETKCVRAITHEITQPALLQALNNPVKLNQNLVDAGLARMCVDKMIGWGLSPLAKKYIGAKSIGRCQSVGLKLVADRETEIQSFVPEAYYELNLFFKFNRSEYQAAYLGTDGNKLKNISDINLIKHECSLNKFIVSEVKKYNRSESPKPPYSTATFQQDAANKLGLSPKGAMSCAQKLFEGISINKKHIGLITYHRTDDTSMSPDFISELKNYIITNYNEKLYNTPRVGKAGAQNGHEALRVVDPNLTPEELARHIDNELLLKVYTLIWQRTIASAMIPAIYYIEDFIITNGNHKFKHSRKIIENPGYKIIYGKNAEVLDDPYIELNGQLENTRLVETPKMTKPKERYTQASLVKALQDKEIGRPSTYATIAETVVSPTRGYAKLEAGKIVPTDRGTQLAAFCDRAFSDLINEEYTANLEKTLDNIAEGNINKTNALNDFKLVLDNDINNITKTEIQPVQQAEAPTCPKCGAPMVLRRSRFGKMFYGCSRYPSCNGLINIK